MRTNARIPLIHKQTLIGRTPTLPVHVQDISVSSKHAQIEMNDDFTRAYLMDLGALNGCFING